MCLWRWGIAGWPGQAVHSVIIVGVGLQMASAD